MYYGTTHLTPFSFKTVRAHGAVLNIESVDYEFGKAFTSRS